MTERGELTYRSLHRASPELLFDCMTTPEHLTHFWGPAGTTTPVQETGYPPDEAYEVSRCLRAVLSEEWWHRRYAERDLAVLEEGVRPAP